ncbi:hypothetical protein [Micromonospora sp. URMC 103]
MASAGCCAHLADASHAMVAERPRELATLVTDFLAAAPPRPALP